MCYGPKTRKPTHDLMLVVVFNGIDVTLHGSSRGALQREARGASRDTEVRNFAAGNIVHKSCVQAVR